MSGSQTAGGDDHIDAVQGLVEYRFYGRRVIAHHVDARYLQSPGAQLAADEPRVAFGNEPVEQFVADGNDFNLGYIHTCNHWVVTAPSAACPDNPGFEC